MSIEKFGHNEYILSCDICGFEENEIFDNFYDAVYFKKDLDNNWKSIKIDGEWNDLCPFCKAKRENEEL